MASASAKRDYRTFFAGEVARLGATPAALLYLPELMPGMAASATHAFMRMAYATMTDSDEETGVALAYWAATYLSLGASRGAKPSTDDPAEVLAFMAGPASFRHVEPERDLLWHFMRAVSEKPEFAPVVDRLAIGPETHDRIARCSLSALCRDARLLRIACGHGNALAEAHGAAHARRGDAAALFLAGHRIAGPEDRLSRSASADELEAWRRARLPDWPEIYREAVARDDEHDLSLTFSAGEEFKHYGDRLYQYAAAKRLSLV